MRFALHEAAGQELEETVVWYDHRQPDLGDRFLRTVLTVFDRLLSNLAMGAPVYSARRVRVPGFPFRVVYRVNGNTLTIVAVAHHRRRPGYWRRR